MRHVFLASIAAATIAASFAGAGFGGVGHPPARTTDLFGGPVAHARVVPIWRERSTPAAPALRRVTCATAVLGDDSACFEASTSG